jgi:hypothetical protein
MTRRPVRSVADNVSVIPVFQASGAALTTPRVHPVQISNGSIRRHGEAVWMEAH